MERLRIALCVLLLTPFAAAAQDEPAAEEQPAAEEAAPAEEAPAEQAAAGEAPAAEEVAPEAEAEEPAGALTGSFVEAFYLPTTALTTKAPAALSTTERGSGLGARGMYRIFKWLAVAGEYQQRSFDDIDEDLSETSAGVGFTVSTDAGDIAGVFFEYDEFDSDSLELDGYSVHGRLTRQQNEWFDFHADLGFLMLQDDVEDHHGAELTFGLGVGPQRFRVVADWHFVDLEGDDSEQRTQLGDVRVGARFTF